MEASSRNHQQPVRPRFPSLVCCGLGIFLTIYGFYIKATFVHGKACDMTYSRPSFIEIDMSTKSSATTTSSEDRLWNYHYRLLKFHDGRDPRNPRVGDLKCFSLFLRLVYADVRSERRASKSHNISTILPVQYDSILILC